MINRGKILIIPHTRLAIAFPLVCCGAMGTAPGGGGTVAELSRTGEVDFPQFEQNGLLSAMDAPQFGQSKVFPLMIAKASCKLPETYSGAQHESSYGVGTPVLQYLPAPRRLSCWISEGLGSPRQSGSPGNFKIVFAIPVPPLITTHLYEMR